MAILIVSSKGQVVLPAALRRRLGMGAGSKLEIVEEADGLKLRVLKPVSKTDLPTLAGMIKAKPRGKPRRLADFDAATILSRSKPENL